MHSVEYTLICSLLLCVTTINGLQPIEHNFLNTFDASDTNEVNYRLPNNTRPENYTISLETNIHANNFDFSGEVTITLIALESTKNITIHHRQLTIDTSDCCVLQRDGMPRPIKIDVTEDKTTEFLVFTVADGLEKDQRYKLYIKYNGTLRTDMAGFYRSSYVNSDNQTRWLATTQFEQTDARHAFPCYDEPALKATFDIGIKHGETYNAVSNMKMTKIESAGNGMMRTTFERTPIMSTYLVAFIISDYKSFTKAASEMNPTRQSIFTPQEVLNQAQYGLTEGVALLNAIEKYLQVPYGLTKMDQTAIPNFRAGAMENWGLVTYRYETLLYDPSVHTVSRQISVTDTISHEYGHQWFGNLVSPVWWSYIWLNEGFATLFQYLGTDLVHPTWDFWNYFVATKMQPVLGIDAQKGTRPMTYYVESPGAVSALFDNIAYAKAGSVIRMFMHALGEETFKKGLKSYLNAYHHNAADETGLFKHLNDAAHADKSILDKLNVVDLFGSWSNQKGFPLVTLQRNENGSITIRQEKYSAYVTDETDKSSWWIPYNLASAQSAIFNNTLPSGWMAKGEQTKLLTVSNDDNNNKNAEIKWSNSDWVILNRQQTGYYRIQYDDNNYNLIMTELNDGNLNKIHPINRAQIIDDLHEFVLRNRVSAKHLCNAINYLSKEKSYGPWQAANKMLSEWHHNFQASKKLKSFQSIVGKMVAPHYDHLTINDADNEPILNKLSRNIAINLACEYGTRKCLQETYGKFQEIINGKKIKPNIRFAAIFNGIRSANDEEITKLWSLFLKSDDKVVRQEIVSSLGNIAKDTTLDEYLKKSIADFNDKPVDAIERTKIITAIAERSQKGLSLAIEFLANEMEKVQKVTRSMPNILRTIGGFVLTKDIESKFSALMAAAKQKGFITDSDIKSIRIVLDQKLKWQNESLKKVEDDFFTAKCDDRGTGSGATSLIAFPATVITILFSILRWYLLM